MTSAAGDAFKFNGKFYEAVTGLYDYAARWYDPVSQRFLSQDPIGWASGQSNLYVYVGNSPLNYTDPSGMMTVDYASLSRAGTTVAGGVVGLVLGFLCGYLDATYSDDPNVRNDAWWYGLQGGVVGAAIGASLAYLGGPGATAAAGAVATGAGLGLAGIFAVSLYVNPGNGKQIAVKVGCIVAGVVAGGIGRWSIRRAGGRGVSSDPIIVAGPGAQQPPIIVAGPGPQGPPIIVSQLPAGPRIPRVGSPGTAPNTFPTIGMRGRVLSAAEQAEFNAFAQRAQATGLVASPYRTGSWGRWVNGIYQEVTRIDVAEAGMPGFRGQTHMHIAGQDGHLPLTTPLPGE